MSQWTHVAGIIRYDILAILGVPEPDLGVTVSFEDEESKWDKCNVPCGSEGSLRCEMWKNPNVNDMASRTAYIFGDLRDYDDHDEIIGYFDRITKGQPIRNAVYTIQTDGNTRTFTYFEDGLFKEMLPNPN